MAPDQAVVARGAASRSGAVASAAGARIAAVGTEVAAVLADQCLVAALGALHPGERLEFRAFRLLVQRHGEDAGMFHRVALLVRMPSIE